MTPEERILKLIDAMNEPENFKAVFREILLIDPRVLRRTGSDELADGLEEDGPWFLMEENGTFKNLMGLVTPQTIDTLFKAVESRKRAETFTTGQAYFDQLKAEVRPIQEMLKDCDAMPAPIQREFIVAVAHAAINSSKAQRILQEAVDKYKPKSGPNEPATQGEIEDSYRSSFDKYGWHRGLGYDTYGAHNIDGNVNYVLNVLELAQEYRETISHVLHHCIQNLKVHLDLDQYAPASRIVASRAVTPVNDPNRPLRPDEIEAAAKIKAMLGLN